MENSENRSREYRAAYKQMKKEKGFYKHLVVYLLVNILILGVNLYEMYSGKDPWSWKILQLPFFWGIGLGAHALQTFSSDIRFGKRWEEKKINEILDKNKKNDNQ
ncbi:hypothetical protein ASG01_05050 [Chryseobacterium sp. Leaf180]|jgi:hypothetical protein|uniref:2TM domain-containing protein n=1 Tax=Chryseobacterium sp. Leaf180 TaxID=1736289 RepID=UPI0006F805E8|nr:2TM domain-containing protein [Chryseobacterium sp. Leaf180]KQR95218.1 hypothetical protein ASG01_05050 [Chryseobacterium sp. Leaf180]